MVAYHHPSNKRHVAVPHIDTLQV